LSRVLSRRLAACALGAALVLAIAAPARAQDDGGGGGEFPDDDEAVKPRPMEPAPSQPESRPATAPVVAPPASGPAHSAEVEEEPPPGFAQEPDEKLRIPRIRLEGAFDTIFYQARAKSGERGLGATAIELTRDLKLPSPALGARFTAVLKVHRFLAFGAEWHGWSATGPTRSISRRLSYGDAVFPPRQRMFGKIEVMQGDLNIRIVAADDARFRAEFFFGMAWISFRLGIHPESPFMQVPFDTRLVQGTSKREEEYFGPTLGLFFCWNFHERVAVFFEQRSGYIAPARFGSLASWARAGFRFHLGGGVEVLVAGAWDSGQILDIRDASIFPQRSPGHVYHWANWFGGGPEIGLSYTY
jgi:hypothetical protein